ncbi:GDSL-type esterase/lipase family protein [Oscillibacter sp.]|uniref:GDSL-type esterase/lipase family protein n=1 Tax=Oscillibacter sp. TaxID=1945593 RepID=UPI0026135D45|nr:GDSL-type esterase/lipase family protein [Oscillibacter sp.]MDD3346724.1 GDSL-type esterase/lipase family protein [Oscillibacter sp.]
MTEKRKKKKGRVRLPGILALLGILAVLLSPVGPAGVAADSPAALQTEEPAAMAETPPEESGETADLELPEAPPAPEAPWAPVPESLPVEDTYFTSAVFLGDSRTEGLFLYSGLRQGAFLYAVGATVESVFSKNVWETELDEKIPLLDALAQAECERVYVMLGVNELGWSKVETFHDQYAKVIDRIRSDHPGAEVVLQSLLPVSAKQEAKKSYVNNSRILAYNDAVMALAQEKECPYLNVAEAVTGEDGCLKPELTSDGVHLNIAGCRIWVEYLRTHSV